MAGSSHASHRFHCYLLGLIGIVHPYSTHLFTYVHADSLPFVLPYRGPPLKITHS